MQDNRAPCSIWRLPICQGCVEEGGRRVTEQQPLIKNSNPLVTIVTVVFNGAQYIEQTINSILSQTYKYIEYILIDGGSTDGTINIIKKYDKDLEYWVSEPDAGIADAMNKGIALSSGDFILFLHADDFLIDEGSIALAVSLLKQSTAIAAFNIIFRNNNGDSVLKPRGFNCWLNFKTGLLHQGVLCSSNIFERIGWFDTDFSIAMDYEFWLRAYREGIMPDLFPQTLCIMRDTGVSSKRDWPTLRRRFSEERMAHVKHAGSRWMRMVYTLYWLLYLPYRYLKNCLA
ncbi:Glycosyl transferase, family 2 [hydrothermal vent metagenome]|uniref:Glycosyl transferase, family 2 n=1 Tax=hydrothermal vent metagenome TaxID=652676 RepID=A0A3B1BFL7_9ZZZZ